MGGRPTSRDVLLLNHNLRGVGTFYRCWHLARNVARLGFHTTLLTVSPSRRVVAHFESAGGVRVVETPNLLTHMYALGWGYGAIGIPYRIMYALRRKFDIVHSFDHKPNVLLPALFSKKMKNTPLLADWSDWWGTTADGSGLQERKLGPVVTLETKMENFIHNEADWVTTISTGLLARATSLGIPSHRITCIPSGAPSDLIRPLDRNQARANLGLAPSTFLLTHLGMGEEQDIATIIPAILAVRKRRPTVRLGIIGPVRAAAFDRPETRESVVLFGRVPFDDLAVYLAASDAFVLSLRDTVVNRTRWPNKFGDYISAGRPVLSSPVGDVPGYVVAHRCGMVWRTPTELASCIEYLMDHPSEASEMGERSRQLAEGELSWATVAGRFAILYRTVLETAT